MILCVGLQSLSASAQRPVPSLELIPEAAQYFGKMIDRMPYTDRISFQEKSYMVLPKIEGVKKSVGTSQISGEQWALQFSNYIRKLQPDLAESTVGKILTLLNVTDAEPSIFLRPAQVKAKVDLHLTAAMPSVPFAPPNDAITRMKSRGKTVEVTFRRPESPVNSNDSKSDGLAKVEKAEDPAVVPSHLMKIYKALGISQSMGFVGLFGEDESFRHLFEMSGHAITPAEWNVLMERFPTGYVKGDTEIKGVTVYSLMNFANKLSRMAGLTPVYDFSGVEITGDYKLGTMRLKRGRVKINTPNRYRLPTVEELAYAVKLLKLPLPPVTKPSREFYMQVLNLYFAHIQLTPLVYSFKDVETTGDLENGTLRSVKGEVKIAELRAPGEDHIREAYPVMMQVNAALENLGLPPAYDFFDVDYEIDQEKGLFVYHSGKVRVNMPRAPHIFDALGYRLPTREEVENATSKHSKLFPPDTDLSNLQSWATHDGTSNSIPEDHLIFSIARLVRSHPN